MTTSPSDSHLSQQIHQTLEQSRRWLFNNQTEQGFWRGKLQSNATIEAQWLLFLYLMELEDHPIHTGLINGILRDQRQDGAWSTYYEAEAGDINTTIECYAALRCYGYTADHPALNKARHWILAQGGLANTRVFTRYWLAMIGEWPWQAVPNLPPEIIRFPKWFAFNIYRFASWARATIVPLCIVSANQLTRPLPATGTLEELFPEGRQQFDFRLQTKPDLWSRFFMATDRFLHSYQKHFRSPPFRQSAKIHCCEWILRHQDSDGAWGGIQPPWIYSLLALRSEGYSLDHPVIQAGISALTTHWSYHEDDATYLQSCESPVWDTALSLLALHEAFPDNTIDQHTSKALDWLLQQQILESGDWQLTMPGVKPGGWAFERANRHYPDTDDTAIVMLVLQGYKERYGEPEKVRTALNLAENWLKAMQCREGGWAAFDRNNNSTLLTKIPFSDFGETIDPPSADLTAHVIEALATTDSPATPPLKRALAYLWQEQEQDGSWFGRWGVNYIYGTGAVLPALSALQVDMSMPDVRQAINWLKQHQNADGGWGESCASYMDESLKGHGDSTASQTAWALMGLVAGNNPRDQSAIIRGADYLIQNQNDQGSWDEPQYTGTGFPGYGVGKRELNTDQTTLSQGTELSRGFMLRYDMYRHYFPMLALARVREYLVRLQ